MSTAQIEVAARRGHPYIVTRDDKGLVRLKRQTQAGRTVTVVFTRDDVIGVANALVAALEGAE